ncbi:hypothetical protein SLA2020_181650 [Shorea laevis]
MLYNLLQEHLTSEAVQKYGEDRIAWPTTVDAQLLSQVSGGPSKDGRLYGMPIYMNPEEQGVSHWKRPPHRIPDSSVQSSQRVVQLTQSMTELQDSHLTLQESHLSLQEKVDRMERMFCMMQGGGGVGPSGGV